LAHTRATTVAVKRRTPLADSRWRK